MYACLLGGFDLFPNLESGSISISPNFYLSSIFVSPFSKVFDIDPHFRRILDFLSPIGYRFYILLLMFFSELLGYSFCHLPKIWMTTPLPSPSTAYAKNTNMNDTCIINN